MFCTKQRKHTHTISPSTTSSSVTSSIHTTFSQSFTARGGSRGSSSSKTKRASARSSQKSVRKIIKATPAHGSQFAPAPSASTAKEFIKIQGEVDLGGESGRNAHGSFLDHNHHMSLQQQEKVSNKDPLVHLKRSTQSMQAIQDTVILNRGVPLTLTPDSNEGKPYFKYGLFRHVQLPPTPQDIHQTIKKRVEQVQAAKGFTNPKDRIKDHVLRRLHLGVQLFLQRIDMTTNTLPPSLTHLHPFEFEIASLTLSAHAHDIPLYNSSNSHISPLTNFDTEQILNAVLHHERIIDNQVTKNSPIFQQQSIDGFTPLRQEGALYYNTVLYNVNKCREHIVHHYHKYKKLINECELPQDFHRVSKEEVDDIEKIISSPQFVQTFALFRSMLAALKSQHWIDPNIPTILCVGAPNVGKSSIVRAMSTSKTPVQMYRFTTRRLTMGHIDVNGFHCQVTDSPGLLPRPDDQRNAMEALTLAAIKHLPLCGIVFVIDPSVQGGVSLQHQLLLRNELRWRYGQIVGNKWIDVGTKADIWKNTYGVRKHTSPLTEPEQYADDPISIMLQQEYHEKYESLSEQQSALAKKRKAQSITPRWNLSEALTELGEIPPGFKDIPLPYFPLSTIHLRDIHNEKSNMALQDRFIRNKRQKMKITQQEQRAKEVAKQKAAAGDEAFGGSNAVVMDIGDGGHYHQSDDENNFEGFSLEQYERWWDTLPKTQQKQYIQATHDTDMLQTAMKAMLGSLIKRVEYAQNVHQQQQIQDITHELEFDGGQRANNVEV